MVAANSINESTTGIVGFTGTSFTATPVTQHALHVGAATTSTLTNLSVGTNGQVLIAATTADPAFATLTSSDSSISFTTGANTLSLQVAGGTSVGKTITGDSGGALSPTAGNWNLLGSGSITTSGSVSTLTTQLTGLTNHNVLIGAGTATITKVAPSATSGVPLISQGASADPTFGTAVVAGGGTGAVTLTNHGVLIGQATSAIVATAAGTAGQVLQSGGASADPVYSTATYPATAGTSGNVLTSDGTNFVSQAPAGGGGVAKVLVQTFTSTGTYTPSTGMLYCVIELVGGGGGSGGCATTVTSFASAGGGGGGGYARAVATAAAIGASKAVTIGAGGLAGTAGANTGGTGGTTSVGALCVATGGIGGQGCAAITGGTYPINNGGAGGVGTTGSTLSNGSPGGSGYIFAAYGGVSGFGGSSFFGGGASAVNNTSGVATSPGIAGLNYGGGASGSSNYTAQTQTAGSAGAKGYVQITEYTT